jgi:transposase
MNFEERCQQLEQELRLHQERETRYEERDRMQQEQLAQQQEMISHLQQQITVLLAQVATLEQQGKRDSHNSHLPPSSDRFVRQPKSLRQKSGKKPGGQEGHRGTTLQFSPTPDAVIVHGVNRCEHCHQDLTAVMAVTVERRQVIEVPSPRVLVQEHRAEGKCCPHCQQHTTAPFPAGVRAPVQYGASIGARAVYLSQQQLLPFGRVCEVMADLVGVALSEGSVRDMIERCRSNLGTVEPQIKTALRKVGVIHQDETGVYVANTRHWMHVTATNTLTHYQVHRSRGHEALEAIGILPGYSGISIHDSFGSYFLYDCQHALCNVHLLRELTYLAEELGLWWAAKLKALLLDMKEATEQAREQGKHWLHPLEVVDWQHQFLDLLAEGDHAHPRAPAPPGQRGRVKQHPARNLLDRLRKHQHAVWAFLQDLRVEFDNNQAERDLRMVKVQQKVSGCFRSVAGAEAFARIRGYLSTLRKQEMPLLVALEATLLGHPILPSFETT